MKEKLPFFIFGCPELCTYCGNPGLHRDHIIPVRYSEHQNKVKSRLTAHGPLTFACPSCNNICKNKHFDSFKDRCKYVQQKLESRSKAIFWTDEQINELDYKLRSFVLLDKNKRLWMRYRADFYSSSDFYLNILSLLNLSYFDSASPDYSFYLYVYFSSILIDLNNFKLKQ